MLEASLVILALAAASPLHTAASAPDSLDHRSMQVDGERRRYAVHRPVGFDPGRLHAAVLVLHGGGGKGVRIARQTGMARHADRLGFVAVFPDAGEAHWNDGRVTTQSFGDDVDFLSAMVDRLILQDAVDPARVFVAGISNGGMMALRLACEATDRFAAFAAVAANLPAALASRCAPTHGVPIVLFAGTADPLMPWAGGQIARSRRRGAGGKVISATATLQFWAKIGGCSEARIERLPNRDDDGTYVRRHSFGSCRTATVRFYEIVGGGHGWPGATTRPLLRRVTGAVTQDIDATTEILNFFRAHRL